MSASQLLAAGAVPRPPEGPQPHRLQGVGRKIMHVAALDVVDGIGTGHIGDVGGLRKQLKPGGRAAPDGLWRPGMGSRGREEAPSPPMGGAGMGGAKYRALPSIGTDMEEAFEPHPPLHRRPSRCPTMRSVSEEDVMAGDLCDEALLQDVGCRDLGYKGADFQNLDMEEAMMEQTKSKAMGDDAFGDFHRGSDGPDCWKKAPDEDTPPGVCTGCHAMVVADGEYTPGQEEEAHGKVTVELFWCDPEEGGHAAQHQVQVKQEEANDDAWVMLDDRQVQPTGPGSAEISGLPVLFTEHGCVFRIRAVNAAGHGPWSNTTN